MRKFGVIVSSDSCFAGTQQDLSGKAIVEYMQNRGYELSRIVILPDERDMLANEMKKFVEEEVPLVLTTGGTGFSKRDVMPEATKDVIEKEAMGIVEAMRMKSLEITNRAMLSRAVAGIANNTLIINMPGSKKAVLESLDIIIDAVEHGLGILLGEESNCGRK
ncbi:MAG: MogA/MoaB family molybdenum cofactor biosynthesis protein [Clostridia bacterium]|nr:MogA/MoaB family molybdenum cofactor biosynthesis protein [Clostridia bacterium]